jgi:uncharacterized protein
MIRNVPRLDHRTTRSLRNLALAGAGVIATTLTYAALVEPRTLLVREMDLVLPTAPSSIDGLTIAFISDLHVGGPGDPLGSVYRAIHVMESVKPDVIVLGGDYYDNGHRVRPEPDWSRFPAIAPTFGVPGNHDYHTDLASSTDIFRLLDDAGIVLLRNRNVDVQTSRGSVRLIGLDDPYTGRADFGQAISGIRDDQHPSVLIAHAGLVADYLPSASADLVLSGHTHAAQVALSPFHHTGPLDVFWWLDILKGTPISPYRQGLFRVNGTLLYVGNGLGTTSLGIRLMAPPEIAIFRLYSGTGNSAHSCDNARHFLRRHEKHWTLPGFPG